jgi:tetratricopeptide (TPR) repeat protein
MTCTDRAEALATEATARSHGLGPTAWVGSIFAQGHVAWCQGALDRAGACFEEAMALAHAQGFAWGIIHATNSLGSVAFKRGDPRGAAARYAAALELAWPRGDAARVLDNLARLATVAVALGQPARAARLAGAADALAEALGVGGTTPTRVDYEPAVAAARSVLGEEVFAAAVAAGRVLPLAEAIAEARAIAGTEALATPTVARRRRR